MVSIADQKFDRYQSLQRMDTSDYWLHDTTSQLAIACQKLLSRDPLNLSSAKPSD
jgi:hypothetical protein